MMEIFGFEPAEGKKNKSLSDTRLVNVHLLQRNDPQLHSFELHFEFMHIL